MNLRGWIFFPPQRNNSKQKCRLWEGFGMDLFNSLHLEDQETNFYRNTEVLLEIAKAVPPELVNPPWKGLNNAHALKQGVGPPNEHCYMKAKGCSTEEASATAMPGLFDEEGQPIYLCVPCNAQLYEYRTVWSCNEDGSRCSRAHYQHKVLSAIKREDCFEAWTLDIVQKWTDHDETNAVRLAMFVKQEWKCPCGRALRNPDADVTDPNSFRSTLIPRASEATLGCDACYTDWSLHGPENATVLQFGEWKTKRAAWRASVDAKPQHEACVCSTDGVPKVADRSVTKHGIKGLDKVCRSCYPSVPRVIETWGLDMDSVEDNPRALRIFIATCCDESIQLKLYPDAPNCPCAGKHGRVPALVEWAVKNKFPLDEPKIVCYRCRLTWARKPAKYKTEDRGRSMFS
jgi:hypothetical protein